MSEQDNSIRLGEDGEASGLLRSVEPAGGASYQMSASDTVDGGADTGSGDKDTGGSGDADSSDEGGDSDGTDATDGDDSDDATADADGSDS